MLFMTARFGWSATSFSRDSAAPASAKSMKDSSTMSVQPCPSRIPSRRRRSALGTRSDVGLFGVTTTAKSASQRIASAANLSTSSWKDGASSANSTTLPAGAAFAYSLNEGTGTMSFVARWPELIKIISGHLATKLIVPVPSFNEYANAAPAGNVVEFALDAPSFQLDVDRFAAEAIRCEADFAVVVTPNNPTSLLVPRAD